MVCPSKQEVEFARNNTMKQSSHFLTLGDHGLDGECVPGLHDADCLVLGVVGDVGGAVEEAVDAVPAVRTHHREALGLRVLLDHVAHVAVL